MFWINVYTVLNINGNQYLPGCRICNFLFQGTYFPYLGAGSQGTVRCLLRKLHITCGSTFQNNILSAINSLCWTTWSDEYAFLYVRTQKFFWKLRYLPLCKITSNSILGTELKLSVHMELLIIIWGNICSALKHHFIHLHKNVILLKRYLSENVPLLALLLWLFKWLYF
jgi:hypothetical protein